MTANPHLGPSIPTGANRSGPHRHCLGPGTRTAWRSRLLWGAALLIALIGLLSGDYEVTVPDLIHLFMGTADSRTEMVVVEWRLPRIAGAIAFGAALGISGALFQTLTRNPLGSPDVIGLDAGAYTGALLAIVVFGGGYATVAFGAFSVGIMTAAAVYFLSRTSGRLGIVVVGIGISAMLTSLNTWILAGARLEAANAAIFWNTGSLSNLNGERLTSATVAETVLLALVCVSARAIRQFELGSDLARTTGVQVAWTRLLMVFAAVGLSAIVTATAGPISFVALVAPHLGKRFTGKSGLSLASAAAMGAVLLAGADQIARHAVDNVQLPVGLLTVTLGGFYLILYLMRDVRLQGL